MRRKIGWKVLGLGTAALAVAACSPSDGDPPREEELQISEPDTTAEALWSHVHAARYAEDWELWPGKDRFYEGTEPHGVLLTTYLNETAHEAIENAAGTMPPGAVVVKENFTPDSTLASITVMYKESGYDPEHNDWFYLKRMADGSVAASGRVDGCRSCHAQGADNDYLMTGSIGGEN